MYGEDAVEENALLAGIKAIKEWEASCFFDTFYI